jgi:hypothetical protein
LPKARLEAPAVRLFPKAVERPKLGRVMVVASFNFGLLFWVVAALFLLWALSGIFGRRRRSTERSTSADASRELTRWQRFQLVVIPGWLATSLRLLGFFFILYKPLGASWDLYASALGATAVTALWNRRRYRQVILRRDERGIIVWFKFGRDARDAQPPHVLIQDGTSSFPDSAQSAPATKLDDLLSQQLITPEEHESLKAPSSGSPKADGPTMKVCPDCAEAVLAAARVCRYCRYRFDEVPSPAAPAP